MAVGHPSPRAGATNPPARPDPATHAAPATSAGSTNGSSASPFRLQAVQTRIRPPPLSRSSCVPRSTIRPPDITQIESARRTVESLCAMIRQVRPAIKRSRSSSSSASVRASNADVGSSKIKIVPSLKIARAIAIRCFSPRTIRSRPVRALSRTQTAFC